MSEVNCDSNYEEPLGTVMLARCTGRFPLFVEFGGLSTF